jgi:hypothetical protein
MGCTISEQQESRISKEQLVEMFNSLEQSNINTDSELLWGYFFIDKDTLKLNALANHLRIEGYSFVRLFQIEQDNKLSDDFLLHMEKIEKHSVESLNSRNMQFYSLIKKFGIKSYDGMDVGKP